MEFMIIVTYVLSNLLLLQQGYYEIHQVANIGIIEFITIETRELVGNL